MMRHRLGVAVKLQHPRMSGRVGRVLWAGLAVGCAPGTPGLPVSSLFEGASSIDRDTGTSDDSGAAGSGVGDAGTTDPTDNAWPPWPTSSDPDMSRGGPSDCAVLLEPCNHEVRLAVGDGAGTWIGVPTALAEPASVPHAMVVDHGERWRSLWITYVDTYPDHINPDAPNVLSTAILAFTDRQAASPEAFAELLDGSGEQQWAFKATNTWELGDPMVDADREMFSDSPIVTDFADVQHAMLVIDLDFETREDGLDNRMFVLGSDDGFTFEKVSELVFDDIGTDPDCFPLDHTDDAAVADYPAVLPPAWAPGGTGGWGCNVSGLRQFYRTDGDLLGQTPSGPLVEGITVTSAVASRGRSVVWGHDMPPDGSGGEGPGNLMRTVEVRAGEFTDPELVIEAAELPEGALGIQAPTVLPIGEGVELLVLHTLRTPPVRRRLSRWVRDAA